MPIWSLKTQPFTNNIMPSKNRHLVFLSGVDASDNVKALSYLNDYFKKKGTKSKSLTFIPVENEDAEEDFDSIRHEFRKIGFKKFNIFPLDKSYDKSKLDQVFDSDLIFLGGGNTFYFLDYLKKRKLVSKLRNFSKGGGTLVGLSAGALVMTPHILLAGFPRVDADEYCVELNELKGLNLVDFEICPHYRSSQKMKQDLMAYSSLYPKPVLGLKDGEFLAIEGEKSISSKSIEVFKNGTHFLIS